MMEETNKIDSLLKQGTDALEAGRYDDAETNAKMALKQARKHKERLKAQIDIENSSIESLGEIAQQTEKIDSLLNSILSLQTTIRHEKDRSENFRTLVQKITQEGVAEKISKGRAIIDTATSKPRTLGSNDKYLICLRRWNSYTPLLSSATNTSQGGGYLLVWNGKSIIIDPGINFVENLFYFGYSICDIDNIILTHSHVDHTADIEAIMTLLHEVNDIRKKDHLPSIQVNFFVNVGTANKFMQLLSISYDAVGKITVMNPGCEYSLSPDLSLTAWPSIHTDLYANRAKCLGLVLTCKEGKKRLSFGLTSDTGYSEEVSEFYSCLKNGMIILHIGSVLEKELLLSKPRERVYPEHLGLRGIFNMIYDIKPKLAIISEMGEEMRETILPIVSSLSAVFPDTIVFPADIGLKIDLTDWGKPFKVNCNGCNLPKDIHEIFFKNTKDKGLIYNCQTCKNATSKIK